VERYLQRGLHRQFGQWHPRRCPLVLGFDEHFFTRRHGYATTLCDLRNHNVYDVVLSRSELSLAAYFEGLEGKAEVRVVCMDLASSYRAVVKKHFPPRPHRGRPVPCPLDHQPPLPGLLVGAGSGGQQEARSAFADAPPPAQSHLGPAGTAGRLSGPPIRHWSCSTASNSDSATCC